MKKRIFGFLLTLCMVIGFIPYTSSASDSFTVTVEAGTGGKVSADGTTWTSRVTATVAAGEKIGDRIAYQADEGYELDSITSRTNITAIAAGKTHTVILDNKGQVYTDGSNGYGQRAIENPEDLTSFQKTTWQFAKPSNGIDGIKIKAIAAGEYHTVLLSEDGDVYTAGRNNSGQLGRDVSDYMKAKGQTRDNMFTKVTVGDGTVKIKAIAASTEYNYAGHTVLIDENGKVWTAGNNYYKQLGRKTSAESNAEFKQVEGAVNNVNIVAAAAGTYQTVLLDSTGQVWTVGSSMYGTNGQGPKTVTVFTKCTIEGNPKITAVAAGDKHTVLLDENGNVYTTGYNTVGQLGLGNNTERNTFAMVPLADGVKIVSIEAGKDYTVLIDENGKVYAAGNNQYGQLGLPTTTSKINVFSPVTIEGLGEGKIVAVAAHEYHTILLDNTGRIWSAGQSTDFQLGRLVKGWPAVSPKFELAISSPVLQETIADLADFTVTGSHTITVNFKEREKVSVTYRLNLGNWVTGFTPPSFYYKGDSFTPPALTNLVREGYHAKSWAISSQTDTTVTYSVSWEEKSGYTIKYNTNGGTSISDKTNVKWNDEVLDGITDPTREGWKFTGWTFEGTEVYNDEWGSPCYSELADSDSTMEITLEATWKDITAPVITGLTSGKTYCTAVEFNATDNDSIASVTVNGTPVQAENGKYTLLPTRGEQKVIVKDNAGYSAEVTVTVNDGHTYEWQSENGQYWQKCKFCDHETAKKAIPEIVITGADRICRTQDYKFSFTLPEGATDAAYGYEFIGLGDGPLTPTVENGLYSGVIKSTAYPAEENSFKLIASAQTADGFEFTAEKMVTIQDKHSGGMATCKDKAICEICGEKYGELDAKNHSDLNHFEAKAATKDTEGNIEYWYCSGCGKYFSDVAAAKEIAKADTVTEKLKEEKPAPAKTGDTSNLALWFALLFISGGVITGVTVAGKKKKQSVE